MSCLMAISSYVWAGAAGTPSEEKQDKRKAEIQWLVQEFRLAKEWTGRQRNLENLSNRLGVWRHCLK